MDRINPVTGEVIATTPIYPAFIDSLERLHHNLISAVAEYYGFAYISSQNPDIALGIYDGYDIVMKQVDGIYNSLLNEFHESINYPENIDAP